MSYYFISIGGTGARVLESLAHMLVAGLFPNKERDKSLYAMSIDPDIGNGNLTRTSALLSEINEFMGAKVGEGTPFLKTPLKLADPFVWSPTEKNAKLDNIIGYSKYKDTNIGYLYKSLYTKEERATILDEGFRGRPSIGAAVMGMKAIEDINAATAWSNLINAVTSDVANGGAAQIFLSGSVFGGTGAAGLPTIAKLLRKTFNKEIQKGRVRIGGALLLPYFSFSPTMEEKQNSGLFASSDNFLINTKAALRYYADNGDSYDSMYFIGDEAMIPSANFSVGAGSQKNNADIVDLFAAMAALHFYRGHSGKHCYYISRAENSFGWQDFPDIEMEDGAKISVRKRFVQFVRFMFFYLHIVKPTWPVLSASKPTPWFKKLFSSPVTHVWYKDYWKGTIDGGSPEVRNFEQYAENFTLWLNQIENSSGGRSVKLIDIKAFHIEDGKAIIDPMMFDTLDYVNSQLTIDAVMTGLTANSAPVGTEEGFGLFLRKIYDSCAVN